MKIDLNINTIENFVIVAEMGNITNAAEKLYITQPTLSRQLLGLEESLNVSLLVRKKNGVSLTAEGEVFYKQCKKLIKAYEEFISKAFEFRNIVVGSLSVAYQKAGEDMMLHFNSGFLREHPNVTITNYRQASRNLVDLLSTKELDFAFIYAGELERGHKHIRSIKVGELKNMVMVSQTNPLAQKERVHLSELSKEMFVLPSKSNAPRKAAEVIAGCESSGFSPQIVSDAVNIVDYILDIVRYDAVAILPYILNVEDSTQVKYLELDGYEPKYPIHLAWNETNSNPILNTYLSFVERQLEK